MRRTPTDRRGGFTLVELLVVITILTVLFALTAAAVVKAMGSGDTVKLRNEISQLAQAVQAFKTQYQVSYIPDRIVLPPGYDTLTAQYFKTVWPRLSATPPSNTLGTGTNPITVNGIPYPRGVFDYWGVPNKGQQAVTLYGDQAIVFFLGGVLDASGNPTGFCTDQTDPMQPAKQGVVRHGPFYEFPANRLVAFSGSSPVNTLPSRSAYRSFVDIYGQRPYLYFSSSKAGNDYGNVNLAPTSVPGKFIQISPYQLNLTRFANPNGFQIVSAGKDGAFGTGGTAWAGATGGAATADGADDMGNFHPNTLGVAAQ
jgi:prepilin-type N-terminal cleavage/methylation domain-containing protein